MSLRGEQALYLIKFFRLMWIEGRLGSFKTALAVRLAYEMLDRGWVNQCVTNFPCVLATRARDVQSMRDTVVILDEAGDWMTDDAFRGLKAALRKINCYVIMPSNEEPPLKGRRLKCQMTLDLHATFVPAVHYVVQLDYGKQKDKSSMWWFNPEEVFGMYDTVSYAQSSGGIIKLLRYEVAKLPREEDADEEEIVSHSAVAGGEGFSEMEGFRGIAETFYEAAQKFDEAISLDQHKGRRGRR